MISLVFSSFFAKRSALALVLTSVLIGGVVVWRFGGWFSTEVTPPTFPIAPAAPDPRLTYTGPLRNVHPEVRYVGDSACASCHPVETAQFRAHPMGRSMLPVEAVRNDPVHRQPQSFRREGALFSLEWRGQELWNVERHLSADQQTLEEVSTPIHYVIGSGRKGHSYLSNLDGFVVQTSVSWFSQKSRWDLSPGFQDGTRRPVVAGCLFCHAGGIRPQADTLNRYDDPPFVSLAISCERCHGPGELHVASRSKEELPRGQMDPTIVNPKHLTPELSEAICQQCHLQGVARVQRRSRAVDDFRPGLPFEEFWSIYEPLDSKGKRKAVSHVEQMNESLCFQKSRGQLGCVTCHDPHKHTPPAERVTFYRDRCLQCHERQQSSCRVDLALRQKENNNSCFSCHMKPSDTSDIPHTATTDHTIPRQPGMQRESAGAAEAVPGVPLQAFYARQREENDETRRDLGLALVQAGRTKDPRYKNVYPQALELLKQADRALPGDIPTLIGQAKCHAALERLGEAVPALEQVLVQEPQNEEALRLIALALQHVGREADALATWEKAAKLYPRDPELPFYRALLFTRKRNYAQALAACEDMLRADPGALAAHVIAAYCHQRLGNAAAAAREEQILEPLTFPGLVEFRTWFIRYVR